jgi:hypothetical protein
MLKTQKNKFLHSLNDQQAQIQRAFDFMIKEKRRVKREYVRSDVET